MSVLVCLDVFYYMYIVGMHCGITGSANVVRDSGMFEGKNTLGRRVHGRRVCGC